MISSSEFVTLRDEWYRRLEFSGFRDIEDSKENLKNYDRRTIAFDNRDMINKFYVRLDHFITEHPELPLLHKRILMLYSEGTYIKAIASQVDRCRWTVINVIKQYKRLV